MTKHIPTAYALAIALTLTLIAQVPANAAFHPGNGNPPTVTGGAGSR
jgi:hypothetical protein